MSSEEKYILKGKIIMTISTVFIILAMGLYTYKNIDLNKYDYSFKLETFDIKQMAAAKVAIKKETTLKLSATTKEEMPKVQAIKLVNKNKDQQPEATKISTPSYPTWRLPTEQGYITQYAHYGHIALDITSSRGTNEIIYPVADGVISGIFYDSAGAKIVTVRHYINGQYYTSEYVHLSWYAQGIYVGKEVDTNTPLGGMGATGIATGIHLHLTVLDCNLFDPNDYNCSDIGKFYRYGRMRLTQGFYGLGNLMNVPYSWYSR